MRSAFMCARNCARRRCSQIPVCLPTGAESTTVPPAGNATYESDITRPRSRTSDVDPARGAPSTTQTNPGVDIFVARLRPKYRQKCRWACRWAAFSNLTRTPVELSYNCKRSWKANFGGTVGMFTVSSRAVTPYEVLCGTPAYKNSRVRPERYTSAVRAQGLRLWLSHSTVQGRGGGRGARAGEDT